MFLCYSADMFLIHLLSGTTIIIRKEEQYPVICSCSSKYVFVQELYNINIYTLKGRKVEFVNMKHLYVEKMMPIMFMTPQPNSLLVIIAMIPDTSLKYIDVFKVNILCNKLSHIMYTNLVIYEDKRMHKAQCCCLKFYIY